MLKFISFGSGSSGNSYYLATDNDALLIDAGIGIRTLKKWCKEYGVALASVRHILVTHDHADHIKAVGRLSHDLNLPVHATAKVHVGITKNYSVHRKVSQELAEMIEKGTPLQLGDFRVTPFDVPHDSTDNTGFFIEADGCAFCLITDAGYVNDEMARYISEANYLVLEANHDEEMVLGGPYSEQLKRRILSNTGHLSNKSCAQALIDNATQKLRKVWLCHLSEENNHPELARKTVCSQLAAHGIVAGKDFEVEVLKRKTPTGFFEL